MVDGAEVEPASLLRCTSAVFQPSKLTVRLPGYILTDGPGPHFNPNIVSHTT